MRCLSIVLIGNEVDITFFVLNFLWNNRVKLYNEKRFRYLCEVELEVNKCLGRSDAI